MNTDNTDSQKLNKIISEIQALQEVVARFRQLRLDATEFACLKCIVTFKAGKQTHTPISHHPMNAATSKPSSRLTCKGVGGAGRENMDGGEWCFHGIDKTFLLVRFPCPVCPRDSPCRLSQSPGLHF